MEDNSAVTEIVSEALLQADEDEDELPDEELLASLAGTMLSSSITDAGRRVSRASFNWFQSQTATDQGLIGHDGKLSDEYILKRQSVNRPATLKTIPMLADLTTDITTIDGWVLTQLFLSGFAKMSKQVDELNKINVFPIADGDTGANMKVCLKLPTRNLLLDPSDSVLTVASNLAADVLLNGQGNSGTILSHFFVSFAEEVKASGKHDSMSVNEFALCLSKAGAKMNDAVPSPVEGTLLSVSRDCCQLAEDGPFTMLRDLIDAWNAKAQAELAKTPDQLVVDGVKVLEKAGVVDSGAQGFVYLVEGMHLAIKGELPEASDLSLFKTTTVESEDVVIDVDHTVTDSKYQFCTEGVVLLKEGMTKAMVLDGIAQAEADLGDSIACVTAPAKEGGNMVKVHIHSNDPELVFERLRTFSRDALNIRKEKVEDMLVMREETHGEGRLDLSEANFTIVGLPGMLLPPLEQSDDLFTLPIFVIPSDTQEPIDARYATASDTCNALNRQRHKDSAIRFTTAASNPMQIKIELLAALARGKPLLVFIMSTDKRVSALGRNTMAAIDMLLPAQQAMITVHIHGWFLMEGLFLREAIQCAREGKSVEEAYERCKELADRNTFFVNFCSSTTVRKLVAWRPGLFPKGFTVEDGQYFAFGLAPKIREGEPLTDFQRAGALMSILGSASSYAEAQDLEIQRIKDTLQPDQMVSSLMVQCVGRPDTGHSFVRKFKEANIPLEGEPTVFTGGFMTVATSGWGEMAVIYKVKTSS